MRTREFAEPDAGDTNEAEDPDKLGELKLVLYADGTAKVMASGVFQSHPQLIHSVIDSLN